MKMLKTLKGKVAAGVVTVTMVSGATFVLADTDAGSSLKQWYDGVFGDASQAALDEGREYGESLVPGLEKEYNELKAGGDESINVRESHLSRDRANKIAEAKDEHVKALDIQKQKIIDGMELQFYNLFVEGTNEIGKQAAKASNYVQNDMTAYLQDTGADAKQRLTDNLTKAKENAVSELEAAIQSAKKEVEDELDSQKATNVKNFKTQIDYAVGDLRKEVQGLVKNLQEEQKNILDDTANGLVDQAEADLDSVVSNINK